MKPALTLRAITCLTVATLLLLSGCVKVLKFTCSVTITTIQLRL